MFNALPCGESSMYIQYWSNVHWFALYRREWLPHVLGWCLMAWGAPWATSSGSSWHPWARTPPTVPQVQYHMQVKQVPHRYHRVSHTLTYGNTSQAPGPFKMKIKGQHIYKFYLKKASNIKTYEAVNSSWRANSGHSFSASSGLAVSQIRLWKRRLLARCRPGTTDTDSMMYTQCSWKHWSDSNGLIASDQENIQCADVIFC